MPSLLILVWTPIPLVSPNVLVPLAIMVLIAP